MQLHKGLKLQREKQGQSSQKSQDSRSLDNGGQGSSKSQNKSLSRDQDPLSCQKRRLDKDKNQMNMTGNNADNIINTGTCVTIDNRDLPEYVDFDDDSVLNENSHRTDPKSVKEAFNFTSNLKDDKNEQIVYKKFVHMSAKELGFVKKANNNVKENNNDQSKKIKNRVGIKQSQECRPVVSDGNNKDIKMFGRKQSDVSLPDKNKDLVSGKSDKTLNCKVCSDSYTDIESFVNHTKSHQGIYVCTMCGKQLHSKLNLENHMSLHSGMKKYVCQMCDKSYSTAGSLKIHSLKHAKDQIYRCTNCFQGFQTEKILKEHWEKICGTIDSLSQSGSENIFMKSKSQNGDCELKRGKKRKRDSCNAELKTKIDKSLNDKITDKTDITYDVEKHEITCISSEDEEDMLSRGDDDDDDDEFNELLDNGQQNSNNKLKTSHDHANDIMNSLYNLYKCDICEKIFIDQPSLTVHNQKHITEKMFKCEVCGKGFIHQHNLTVHKRLHEGDVVNLSSSQE